MSRQSVLTGGFVPHGHGHGHGHSHGHSHVANGHYGGVHAQSAYDHAVHSGLAFGRPLPIRAPVLAPAFNLNHQQQHPHQHQHPHPHPHPHGRPSPFTMADQAYLPSDDDYAHLQKLSSEYEAEAAGPLVGERQSSAAITTQYANADPVYRIKTAALPAKYAFFRTCRGDGHCGWRAIAFTYFEALLRVGDVNKFDGELVRLNSMANLLDQIGYSRDIWIDFADEAFDLLRKLASSLHVMDGAATDILQQSFNDMNVSMAIITYFKLLASAWVQSHADDYTHFVPMGDVKAYCANNIEPSQCEIDNIGVAALADALVKPAGFGLEVLYLDRSPGEEINRSYYAEPTTANHIPIPHAAMLSLLYRPGHYDILYKTEEVPSIPQQPDLTILYANNYDDFVPQEASAPDDVMTMIPGLCGGGLGQRWPPLSYDFSSSPAPQAQVTPVQPFPSASMSAPSVTSSFVTPIHTGQTSQYNPPRIHSIQLEQPPITLPIHPPPPPPVSIERATPIAVERGGPFRPSMYELEPGFGFSNQAQPFQTSIFRNSHFNTAHFMNPEFQPEEWCPDGDYATGNKGRHKSHSS